MFVNPFVQQTHVRRPSHFIMFSRSWFSQTYYCVNILNLNLSGFMTKILKFLYHRKLSKTCLKKYFESYMPHFVIPKMSPHIITRMCIYEACIFNTKRILWSFSVISWSIGASILSLKGWWWNLEGTRCIVINFKKSHFYSKPTLVSSIFI